MKKYLYKFLIVILMLSFVGCAGRDTTRTAEEIGNELKQEKIEKTDFAIGRRIFQREYTYHRELPEELTFGMIGFIGNMNPFYSDNPTSGKIFSMLYRPLFDIKTEDYKDKIENVLAEDVKFDNKKVTIKLKKGIKWHDGVEMTADDIIYTYKYLIDNRDTVYNDYMYLDGNPILINKIDQYTVELKLDRYSGSILQKLSEIKILPKHIYEGKEKEEFSPNEPEMLIGNSAYAFSKYSIDEKYNTEVIELVYFENSIYEKPQFEKILLRSSANFYTNRYDLLDYNMQVGYILPNDTLSFKNELYKNEIFEEGYDIAMVFKTERKHVNTPELRHLVADMLTPNSLTGYFGMTNYTKAADSIFGITTKYSSPQNAYFNAQTGETANQLRRYQVENGGEVLHFGFKMEEGEFQERIAITLQELFRTQELNFKIAPLFEEEYFEGLVDANTDLFDYALYKYKSMKSPDAYRKFFKEDGSHNYSGYYNQDIIKLLDEADSKEDYIEAQIAYNKVQKLLYEELPMYPIANVKTSFIYDDRMDVSEAIPNADSYFRYPEKIKMAEKEVDESLAEKYELKPEQVELKPQYDNVNILAKKYNEGKIKGE